MDLDLDTTEGRQAETDPAAEDGGALLPALPARFDPALPTLVFDADDRWAWALDRAERLLPDVVDMLSQHLTLPSDLEINLVGRWRLAREYGARTAETQAGYIGVRYRRLLIPHTFKALMVNDWAVWANDIGRADVFVNVRRAADGDREFGATLASAVVMAALMSSYSRAAHLRTWAYFTGRPRYDVPASALLDMRLALLDSEEEAAEAAAAEWRSRFDWLHPAIARAGGLLRALDRAEHVTTWQERAVDHAAVTVHTYYSGEREPQEVDVNALWALREWVRGHGTEATGEGEQLTADRRARLQAAAWTDYRGLARLIEDGEPYKYMDDLADELGYVLYAFDVAHGTGRGELFVDHSYWAATRNWRGYAQQEWAAAQQAKATAVAAEPDAEAVDRPDVVIRNYYTANEPEPGTIADVHDLLAWNNERRTESYPSGLPVEDERARRLSAAALCDLMALQAEVEGNAEEQAALTNTAVLLAWDLRDFDAAHSTGRGWRGPEDLYWEAPGLARTYTRQEWASHTVQQPSGNDER